MEEVKKEIMAAIQEVFRINGDFDVQLKNDLKPIVEHLQNALDLLEAKKG